MLSRTENGSTKIHEQKNYLGMLAKRSLAKGDVASAIQRLEAGVRLLHRIRNRKTRSRLLFKFGSYDHWKIGCCHAALGPEHHRKALAHLNVVRRYCGRRLKRIGEFDDVETVFFGRALAALARIYNLEKRHDRALACADEGLRVLYQNEALQGRGASDLVQMLCYSARGDAMRGLGHCGEAVIRNYEQVLLHYQRHVSAVPDGIDRRRLLRESGGRWPWARDRLYPAETLGRMEAAVREMAPGLTPPMQVLARSILRETESWREDAPVPVSEKTGADAAPGKGRSPR
jgi:tetratricopeptide (TPR) repeat protein